MPITATATPPYGLDVLTSVPLPDLTVPLMRHDLGIAYSCPACKTGVATNAFTRRPDGVCEVCEGTALHPDWADASYGPDSDMTVIHGMHQAVALLRGWNDAPRPATNVTELASLSHLFTSDAVDQFVTHAVLHVLDPSHHASWRTVARWLPDEKDTP